MSPPLRGGLVSPPLRGGLVVVDKPAGLTSHDVVARIRRLADTRRVGHAGTLDPMATGVLLVGIGRATRLLGHLALHDKDYDATIRLGQTTSTDDAEGQVLDAVSTEFVTEDAVAAAVTAFVGEIEQRPPAVSAIKVDGQRAYKRVRDGEDVVLASRKVTVSRFDITGFRRHPAGGADADLPWLEFDAQVTCSTGTYIRALARDVGAALSVGGHLTALRRTRVGAFDLTMARTLADLETDFSCTPLNEVAAAAFVRRDLDADEAERLSHGGKLTTSGGSIGLREAINPSPRSGPTASSSRCWRTATAWRARSRCSSAEAEDLPTPGRGSTGDTSPTAAQESCRSSSGRDRPARAISLCASEHGESRGAHPALRTRLTTSPHRLRPGSVKPGRQPTSTMRVTWLARRESTWVVDGSLRSTTCQCTTAERARA